MPAAAWRGRQGRRSEHAEDAAAVGVLLKSLFSLSSLWCTARLRRARRDGTSGVEPPARTSGRRGDWSGGGRGTIGHGDDGDGRQTRHDSLPPPMSSVPPTSPCPPRAPCVPRGGFVAHRLPEWRRRRERERGGGLTAVSREGSISSATASASVPNSDLNGDGEPLVSSSLCCSPATSSCLTRRRRSPATQICLGLAAYRASLASVVTGLRSRPAASPLFPAMAAFLRKSGVSRYSPNHRRTRPGEPDGLATAGTPHPRPPP